MKGPIEELVAIIEPSDKEYPLIMRTVKNYEQYSIIKIGDTYCVPLFQVIDAISEVKSDITIKNGTKYCSNCGAKLGKEGDEFI